MADEYRVHTVVGTPARGGSEMPTVVLLNRSSRLLRKELFGELTDGGFHDIVSVELQSHSYSVESLTRQFEGVRCILTERQLSVGEQIMLACRYAQNDHLLVMWSTMAVPSGVARARKLLEKADVFAVAPTLRGERGEVLPTLQVPAIERRALRILNLPVRGDGGATLAPYDWVALYDAARIQQIGGFDADIRHPFWQRIDLFFRAHLFGYRVPLVPAFRCAYNTMPAAEDQTNDAGYARFFARNLAVRLGDAGAFLPRGRALAFALRSRSSLGSTLRTFDEARAWIEKNHLRFVIDPRELVDKWNVDHG